MVFLIAPPANAEEPNQISFTVKKLRLYCAACHAVGKVRFIYSDEDETVWRDLFTKTAPVSKRIWSKEIVDVLSWPTSTPPPFGQMIHFPNKDWMPKGAKRIALAKDIDAGTATRHRIIEALSLQINRDLQP